MGRLQMGEDIVEVVSSRNR